MHRPVRQAANPAAAGHQLHHHHGHLGGAYLGGLEVGGVEEAGEDVQAVALDRVCDQGLAGDVGGFQVGLFAQGMVLVNGQHCLVAEQWYVGDTWQGHRVGGHHQVEVPPFQGRQWRERQP
ncbi:hypothetical protein D3C76_612970 [compost metagenome]